jgi:hypothetical protein
MKTIIKTSIFLLINLFCLTSFSQNETKVTIAGNMGENLTMTREDLLKAGELTLETKELNCSISSFTFSYAENGLTKEIFVKGNKFSEIAIEAIKKTPIGVKVYFENIQLILADGKTKNIPSIIIKLVEK